MSLARTIVASLSAKPTEWNEARKQDVLRAISRFVRNGSRDDEEEGGGGEATSAAGETAAETTPKQKQKQKQKTKEPPKMSSSFVGALDAESSLETLRRIGQKLRESPLSAVRVSCVSELPLSPEEEAAYADVEACTLVLAKADEARKKREEAMLARAKRPASTLSPPRGPKRACRADQTETDLTSSPTAKVSSASASASAPIRDENRVRPVLRPFANHPLNSLDLQRIVQRTAWLNDVVVNAGVGFVRLWDANAVALTTHFVPQLRQDKEAAVRTLRAAMRDVERVESVHIPVHLHESHFCLMVLMPLRGCVVVLDTMGSGASHEKIAKDVRELFNERVLAGCRPENLLSRTTHATVPAQRDAHNCGVLTVAHSHLFALARPSPLPGMRGDDATIAERMHLMRKRLLLSLVAMCVP